MRKMKHMKVLILAGGHSTRFWPLKEKLFTTFLGRPLLYYRLLQLSKFGYEDITIVGNKDNAYLFENFKVQYPQFPFQFVLQDGLPGMGGAVLSAKNFISGKSVLVLKPLDIFEDILLDQLNQELLNNPESILTGFKTPTYFPGGYLAIENNEVVKLIEKPGEGKEPSNIVRLVFDYFKNSNDLISALENSHGIKDDWYEIALESLISKNVRPKVMLYKGYWGYLQYPWHVLPVSENFLSKIKSYKGMDVDISESAVLKGTVHVGDGVKILENAKIIGPVYIGKNSIIGNNCIVRSSTIGENCVIGFSTEIARSYVGNNCWFHSNYIGDSVIADNVGVGAGTNTANFRLDEGTVISAVNGEKIDTQKEKLGAIIGENVRIGVNVSIMPGIKIGSGVFVGAGITLDRDVPANHSIYGKQELVLKLNKKVIRGENRITIKNRLKL